MPHESIIGGMAEGVLFLSGKPLLGIRRKGRNRIDETIISNSLYYKTHYKYIENKSLPQVMNIDCLILKTTINPSKSAYVYYPVNLIQKVATKVIHRFVIFNKMLLFILQGKQVKGTIIYNL